MFQTQVVEKIETQIFCSITFSRAVYEITWTCMVQVDRSPMTV